MTNEMLAILADIPPMLAAAWAAWLGAGLLLTIWYRRAKATLEEQQASMRSVARAKSGARPVARAQVPPPLSSSARSHAAPPAAVKGDPFADLAQIFDETAPAPGQRPPGDSVTQRD
jgi:hypothetical protein